MEICRRSGKTDCSGLGKANRVAFDQAVSYGQEDCSCNDNLNTHSIASLYATFPPQHARSLAERLEIHYTPKHGSWLDIAEIELSALGRQCIADNRIPDLPSLRALLKPWATARNAAQKGVDWHFTTVDARFKLKHLYPIINI